MSWLSPKEIVVLPLKTSVGVGREVGLGDGRVIGRSSSVKGLIGQSSPTNAQVPLKDGEGPCGALDCGRKFLLGPCRKSLRSAAVLLR